MLRPCFGSMQSNDRWGITGMATSIGLEVLEFRTRVGKTFSALIQTGLGAYPASSTMGTDYFPGIKRPERGANHLSII